MKRTIASMLVVFLTAGSVIASDQLALSLRQRVEKDEVVLDILVTNLSKTSVEITSKGIVPPWSVCIWFDWAIDGKPAEYWENVGGIPEAKESWRVPPKGVILWGSIPLRELQIKTKDKLFPAITDKKPHVVSIRPGEQWKKKDLSVKSGSITVSLPKVPTPSSARPNTEESVAETKLLFIFMETISRLEKNEQKEHIPYLYKDLYATMQRPYPMAAAYLPVRRKPGLSPEELAEGVLAHGFCGQTWLMSACEKTRLDILKEHRAQLLPLIKADLASEKKSDRERAIRVIGDLKITDQFEAVLHIFETDDELSNRAMCTLKNLHDLRAIAPIIKKYPDLGSLAYDYLRDIETQNAADPSLIALLESKDPNVRWRASYALSQSGDPKLVPHFIHLAKDENLRVRKQAVLMGHFLFPKARAAVRPTFLKLLSDPDIQVKSFTVRCLAERKDMACIKTLLELLKDPATNEFALFNLVQAMRGLAGSDFGYRLGPGQWQPTTENNQQAIRRFEEWVEKHMDDKSEIPKTSVRATLEADPERPGWFVMHVTNISKKTVRFPDIREGAGWCGEFYEITVIQNGKARESKGFCWYAPGDVLKIVELAPGKTYDRDIQPGAYYHGNLVAPYEVSVTYRLTEKMKKMMKGEGVHKAFEPYPDKVDLDFTFQTTKAKIHAASQERKPQG